MTSVQSFWRVVEATAAAGRLQNADPVALNEEFTAWATRFFDMKRCIFLQEADWQNTVQAETRWTETAQFVDPASVAG